jgi:hypothetical protein
MTRNILFRGTIVTGAIIGVLLFAAGCGGEKSELCQSLADLQESVQGLRDVELGEGALDELQQSADAIRADLGAVENAAGAELAPELASLKTAAEAVVADLDAAASQGKLTRDSTADLVGSVSGVVTAFGSLRDAAPDCDL